MQPFRPEDFHNQFKTLQKTGKHSGAVEGGGWDPGLCDDRNKSCEKWAGQGECEKNPDYMKGSPSDNLGTCRKSCKVCQTCAKGNRACYRENRELAGYLDLADEVLGLTSRELPKP